MNNIIEIRNLTKTYTDFKLENINLSIPKGCIMGLVGENGAGKTTLIKTILNIVKKNEGQILVFDQDNILYEKEIKEQIGVVLDDAFFADTLKVNEICLIASHLYHKWDQKTFDDYLVMFSLPKDKPVKTFSKGMKKKLEIAVALSHHPRLLILDEPTSGLDPIARNEILDILRDFNQNEENGILISSHITSDLEYIADYVTFINQGKLLFSMTNDELVESYGLVKCTFSEFNQLDDDDIIRYKKYPYNYDVLVKDRQLMINKYTSLKVERPTIEDIMLLYIKGEAK